VVKDPHQGDVLVKPDNAGYELVASLFLRLLALIYLVAFVSIGVQILGLAGAEGILPFADELRHAEARLGSERFWLIPTLFWVDVSDFALQGVAVAGCVFSVLLLFNLYVRSVLVLLFLCYLSLFQAGQLFMNFQWDYLLLESGFLAIFLPRGPRLVIWLFRWLLFRVRFLSGASKLISEDPSWSNLTALEYYFETQPLPHWVAWYVHQLPEWFMRFSAGTVLCIEILVPFMMFMSRGPRFVAAWATLSLQALILLTSNHNFFNLLTMVLCLFLFDDRALRRVMPASLVLWLGSGSGSRLHNRRTSGRLVGPLEKALAGLLAGLILLVSAFQIWEMFSGRRSPAPVATVLDVVAPFRIVNKYHVFPTMKTERKELIVEGSHDGEHWESYIFKYKPGPLDRRPQIVIPHQPRLDWMMWFVPAGHPLNMMWFDRFLRRLLRNAPPVVDLLETNPFPDKPPRYLRTSLYRYSFTDRESREARGHWWERDYLGPFYPWPWMLRPENHLAPPR
jgi:hypothetical protein